MPPRSLQPLRVDDPAGRHVDVVRTDSRFSTAQASRALDQELGEARLVEQRHGVAHRPALGAVCSNQFCRP